MSEERLKRLKREWKQHGIELIDENRNIFKCLECGAVWSPDIQPGGKFPRGYWKCVNGCNVKN